MTSPTTNYLNAVWGSSASDVFAVGYDTIVHYDGSAWTTLPPPNPTPGNRELTSVWGSSGNDVFAVRGSDILHYNGSTWEKVYDADHFLYAVWGSSASDVFAVGLYGTILHYNGNGWSAMASPTTNTLQCIWGTSGSNIYAGGDDAILHYNGTSWAPMSYPGSFFWLNSIWGTSGGQVYAVGIGGIFSYGVGITTSTSSTTSTIPGGTTTTTPGGTTTISVTTTVTGSTTTSASISSTTIPSTSTTTIIEPVLKADFVRDKASGAPPLVVKFTDMSSGNITSYLWDFGDKVTSTERNPSHTYLSEGTYTVSLRVEGDGKADDEVKSGYITVKYNSPTTTTVPAFCPFNSYVGNYEDKETIRMFRDNISNTPSGLLLISLYYKNISEISQILINNYELRNCFQQLVIDKTWIAKQLVIGQKAVISRDMVNEFIDFLNKIKKHGSPSLQSDIDLVASILDNDSLQKEVGIITIR
jgi:hypothetical protein